LPNILSYLDYYELCHVSQVSKGMYMFSVDDDIWKHLAQKWFADKISAHLSHDRAWKYEFRKHENFNYFKLAFSNILFLLLLFVC
jgi:hypothetical protein